MIRQFGLVSALIITTLAHAASIEDFSPQGEQLEIRQAQARFSAPMTALGQSNAPAPFKVECGVTGSGHWVDERTWVYDLDALPQAGAGCRFKLKPGLSTLTGEKIDAAAEYTFSVAGPRILSSLPSPGSTLDEDQVFVLLLNGAAEAASLVASTHCEAQGIHEQIPAVRLAGSERNRILRQLKDQLEQLGENWNEKDASKDPRLEVLRCQRTLPANAKAALVWGEGISTPSGQRNPSEQRLEFNVRDHFVARMRCQKENAKAGCLPLTPIRLDFTAPVARDLLDRITLKDAKGKTYPQKKAEHPEAMDDSIVFAGPFPADTGLALSLPGRFVDDKGRALINAARFPLQFQVADLPPLVKFAGEFGIIERVAGGLLPITLRNLEPDQAGGSAAKLRWVRITNDAGILDWQTRLHQFDNPPYVPDVAKQPDPRRARLLTSGIANIWERSLPKPNGAQTFEVVGLPLEKPGYYVLEAESQRLGKSLLGENRPMYVRTSALVTNLAVHFKWGTASSLAWVTRLDLGTPVAGAAIAVRDCHGRLFAETSTDKQGMALLPKNLPNPESVEYDCPLYVSARKDDDLSFARSDWNEGIETWRFGLPDDWSQDNRIARSLLDRTLFRPGETVHMKHILRDTRDTGLGYPNKLPPTLQIEHGGSNQRWFLPLTWKNGAALTDWKVPEGTKRGDYSLRLLNAEIRPNGSPEQLENLEGLDSGAFSVGDFRVPLMRAEIDPVSPQAVAVTQAEFDLAVRYLNGGGAKNLPVKLRAQLEPRHRIEFADFKGIDFAQRRNDDSGSEESEPVALPGASLKLDASGTGRGRITALPALNTPHTLRVELEYADPNGEIQTVSRSTPWWPANVVLGLKNDHWTRAGKTHTLRFQAVDLAGKAAAEVPVEAKLTLRQTFTHRVRLAGGFYGYNNEMRETAIAGCAGKTDAKGQFSCEARTEQGGEVLVSARALDTTGRAATTHHSFWVAGSDEWSFDQANHDRIDLIPEKKRYEPGETAHFQVRMPYRNATALVTVEREGILDARVVTLSGKSPVLDIPVRASWAPNVFVSALVVRGRNDEIKPTALIDLGRPSFKLGIAGIEVGQRAHQLEVEVKTDRTGYQIREKAKARIKVRTPEGGLPPAGTEVTLAAVDEGLLELAPNDSWNLLEAMMAARGYSMHTFTAQMQVTGKRHFGKKALPAGGGGGKLPTRELFDTLLFWQANVALDAQGEASVEIPLNDSLTSFRIVAIAASENRFGTGKTAIRSNQDLQLISGLSPVVREGDRLQAYFTVRNGSQRGMKIEVNASVKDQKALTPQTITLTAGEAREIVWPVVVPESNRLEWTLNAKEVGGKEAGKLAHDALKVNQAIHAAVPVRVQSASLYRLDQAFDLPVAAPRGSLPNSGELRATLSASLADGQTGLRDYMRHYPFSCLEQKVSKAVAMQDRAAWDALTANLPAYLADNGLANYFPGSGGNSGGGSIALTAYVLAISDQAGWSLPLDAQTRMQRALTEYLAGQIELQRNTWENPVVLRLAALEALSRSGRATPTLIATLKPEPTLWPSSALIDWIGILQKSPKLADRDALLRSALAALDARFTQTGKRLNFNSENRDDLWWMMTSADTNAVRALLTLMPEAGWKDRLPKLVTGALTRQQNGRWNTTTANAWGVLALQRYQQQFEAVKPSGKSYAVLGKDGRLIDWKAYPKGATAFLPLGTETTPLKLKHEGEGQPYVSVTTLAAVPLTAPLQRGYSVKREIIPIDQKTPGKWSRGDVLRVRLNIDARDDMGWVVVEDPIPAGASILSSGKQRSSALLTQSETNQGNAWPTWQERLFDTYRAYYEYTPRGRFSLEYTLRLNSDGKFQLPPTRVEAMYAPEMFGEAPNGEFEIAP